MERKKWTTRSVLTDADLIFREKRKWQVALRRYVLEGNPSAEYAAYFGLGIEQFRQWIALQFAGSLDWGNFGKAWQLDHIVPPAYFDFSLTEELKLCWNFINIRVAPTDLPDHSRKMPHVIAAKPYFDQLYRQTGYRLCLHMVNKIAQIETEQRVEDSKLVTFMVANREQLEALSLFEKEDFISLNQGSSVRDILLEKEIIKKFS